MTPNELVLTFGGLHVCVQFGENRLRNASVRVSTDEQTHTHTRTDAKRFYYLSHAICYSYGADKKTLTLKQPNGRGHCHVTHFIFFCPNHIFGTGEAKHFKFGVYIEFLILRSTSACNRLLPMGCACSHVSFKNWEITDNGRLI